MGINGLTGYQNPYISYRMNEIPKVTEEQVIQQDQKANTQTGTDISVNQTAQTITEDKRSRAVDLENISLTFHKEESFDYIGSNSSLESLDMQRAISDMKKDEVLQGYQYFVGNTGNSTQTPDGAVFQKLGL